MDTLDTNVDTETERIDVATLSPRRPWVAGVLSMIAPGVGHVYAGAPRRGLIGFAGMEAIIGAGFTITVLLPPSAQLLGLALTLNAIIVATVVVAWDAVRVARRRGGAYSRRWYNRWYVYLGLYVFENFICQPMLLRQLRGRVFEAYSMPSESMAPALRSGDYIFATPLRTPASLGEVVAYRLDTIPYVKRIVGVPGDTLAMRDGQLIVNGHVMPEPYATRADTDRVAREFGWQRKYLVAGSDTSTYRPSLKNWGPLVTPSGKYFILGDNRGESYDSRYIGFISRSAIFAHPTVIYFSHDPTTRVIRWERIGRAIR
ncbi:MAG TPA: signal peptidase I [Gemmatimonadaceae bacterium]|nr:signal peptidase I [Gemmatimonadaceae bacterium]